MTVVVVGSAGAPTEAVALPGTSEGAAVGSPVERGSCVTKVVSIRAPSVAGAAPPASTSSRPFVAVAAGPAAAVCCSVAAREAGSVGAAARASGEVVGRPASFLMVLTLWVTVWPLECELDLVLPSFLVRDLTTAAAVLVFVMTEAGLTVVIFLTLAFTVERMLVCLRMVWWSPVDGSIVVILVICVMGAGSSSLFVTTWVTAGIVVVSVVTPGITVTVTTERVGVVWTLLAGCCVIVVVMGAGAAVVEPMGTSTIVIGEVTVDRMVDPLGIVEPDVKVNLLTVIICTAVPDEAGVTVVGCPLPDDWVTVTVLVALAGDDRTLTTGEAGAGTIIVEPVGAEAPELNVIVEYTTTKVAEPLTDEDGLGDTVIVEPCNPFWPGVGVTV